MPKLCIFLLVFLLFSPDFSATNRLNKMAIFDLKKTSDRNYMLHITFDRANLLQTLKDETPQLNESEGEAEIYTPLVTYLRKHLAFTFDELPVEIGWQSAKVGTQFVTVRAKVVTQTDRPGKIFIRNTCLVDKVSNHTNLVRIYLYENKRIFRLDAHRRSTIAKYGQERTQVDGRP